MSETRFVRSSKADAKEESSAEGSDTVTIFANREEVCDYGTCPVAQVRSFD